MNREPIPFWKEAPCIRIVIPVIAGIIIYRYQKFDMLITAALMISLCFLLFMIQRASLVVQFKTGGLQGLLINIVLCAAGILISAANDRTAGIAKTEKLIRDRSWLLATLKGPPSEKPKSWKLNANINVDPQIGMLIYFSKDNANKTLPVYGQTIAFLKPPKRIENLPVFGDFDYKQYCALKNIHYQVFLHAEEYLVCPGMDRNPFQVFLLEAQNWTTNTLKKFIPGKKEAGLAEALLIGYKDDLDKSLIQSYSITGIMHVVAISGLHLGLIYAILRWLSSPLGSGKAGKWAASVITIAGLWIFSFLAGGSPSVLRSAVMFTVIVIGNGAASKASLYNNLAASALLLLAADPNNLWDIGFQLSYAALLSIGLYMKPIYDLMVFENKGLDAIWKLSAVTLAAQVLTLPVSIYYFHQFPNLFLITNLIAVPGSSIILLAEIALCAVSFFGPVAEILGKGISIAIRLLNDAVEGLAGWKYANIDGLTVTLLQTLLAYGLIAALSAWLLAHRKQGLFVALVIAILIFAVDIGVVS